jgi:nucleoside-diphosphate-sugar epimerase
MRPSWYKRPGTVCAISTADMSTNHALVFGASGLAGWAVVDQLLRNYPAKGAFGKVTALVNRPLKLERSFWSLDIPERPELQLVDGINLVSGSPEEFLEALQKKVKGMEDVTHVYYFGEGSRSL